MTSKIEIAQAGPAPSSTHCLVLGQGDNVRIAFLTGTESEGSVTLLSAVTLTRSQLTGFAGMVSAMLDVDDQNAASLS